MDTCLLRNIYMYKRVRMCKNLIECVKILSKILSYSVLWEVYGIKCKRKAIRKESANTMYVGMDKNCMNVSKMRNPTYAFLSNFFLLGTE